MFQKSLHMMVEEGIFEKESEDFDRLDSLFLCGGNLVRMNVMISWFLYCFPLALFVFVQLMFVC